MENVVITQFTRKWVINLEEPATSLVWKQIEVPYVSACVHAALP